MRYPGVAATVAPLGADPTGFCFTLGGHECIVDYAFRPAMEQLLSGEAVDFRQLAALAREMVCREGLRGLLNDLITASIVHLIPCEEYA